MCELRQTAAKRAGHDRASLSSKSALNSPTSGSRTTAIVGRFTVNWCGSSRSNRDTAGSDVNDLAVLVCLPMLASSWLRIGQIKT